MQKHRDRLFLSMEVCHSFICHDKRVKELYTRRHLFRDTIAEDALSLLPVHCLVGKSKECFWGLSGRMEASLEHSCERSVPHWSQKEFIQEKLHSTWKQVSPHKYTTQQHIVWKLGILKHPLLRMNQIWFFPLIWLFWKIKYRKQNHWEFSNTVLLMQWGRG